MQWGGPVWKWLMRATLLFSGLPVPRIDNGNRQVAKVSNITSCQNCVVCQSNTCNKGVTHVYRTTASLAISRQLCCLGCGMSIKEQDTVLQVILQKFLESFMKQFFAATGCHQGQTKSYFKQGDAVQPDGLGRLPVQPSHYLRVGLLLHQARQDVGVEHNHELKLIGSMVCPRSSTNGSVRPTPANRAAIRDPRF